MPYTYLRNHDRMPKFDDTKESVNRHNTALTVQPLTTKINQDEACLIITRASAQHYHRIWASNQQKTIRVRAKHQLLAAIALALFYSSILYTLASIIVESAIQKSEIALFGLIPLGLALVIAVPILLADRQIEADRRILRDNVIIFTVDRGDMTLNEIGDHITRRVRSAIFALWDATKKDEAAATVNLIAERIIDARCQQLAIQHHRKTRRIKRAARGFNPLF